ncbi:helix-turn-helix domain-containing protein [Bacillus cereus group sp. N21]|uniref:MarR family transcriptional regulator n=1 Tax=Bacillus cereus group sp. N21 TaxID=2794591 RepID=UPI0018F2BA0A|nr:helix-turn-helix domain-containing protein [Bacillus cereus group sp. N21]MBJ8027262.1 MarR family transcriptional regulator [Bacillus cereus group sp. N21]
MNLQTMTGQELMENGYTLQSPAQKEAQAKYLAKLSDKDRRHFAMLKRDNYTVIRESLTLQQHGVLLFLATCMRVNKDGKLFNEDGQRLTVKDLKDSLGKSQSQVNRILAELEANGVIVRVAEGKKTYVDMTNAIYVCEKLKEDYKVVKIFKAHLQEKAKTVSLNALGLFGMLLSHMSWTTNLVVENPDEPETSKLVLLKRKHIMETFSLSRPTVVKLMSELTQARLLVEVRTVTDAICLDPKAVSRQSKRITFEELLDNIEEASLSSANFKK